MKSALLTLTNKKNCFLIKITHQACILSQKMNVYTELFTGTRIMCVKRPKLLELTRKFSTKNLESSSNSGGSDVTEFAGRCANFGKVRKDSSVSKNESENTTQAAIFISVVSPCMIFMER